MIRYILAFIASSIFAFLGVLLGKALKYNFNKILYVFTCIVSVVIFIVLSMIPMENAFVTFNSPKDSVIYTYKEYDAVEISEIIYGKKSCMLLSEINDAPQFSKKSEKGWKVASVKFSRFDDCIDNCYISVYKIRNTNDYYIGITVYYKSSPFITDSNKTEFKSFESSELTRFFGYVNNFDETYTININGTTVNLGELYF